MCLSKLWDVVKDREAWHTAVHRVAKSWTWLRDWTTTIHIYVIEKKKVHIISFQLHIYVYMSAYIFILTYPHTVSTCVYIFFSLMWKLCPQISILFYFITIIFSAQLLIFIWGIFEWLCQILSHRETEVAFWQFGGKGASEGKQMKPLTIIHRTIQKSGDNLFGSQRREHSLPSQWFAPAQGFRF